MIMERTISIYKNKKKLSNIHFKSVEEALKYLFWYVNERPSFNIGSRSLVTLKYEDNDECALAFSSVAHIKLTEYHYGKYHTF